MQFALRRPGDPPDAALAISCAALSRPGAIFVHTHIAWQAEHPLAEDVAHDLRRSPLDGVCSRPEEEALRTLLGSFASAHTAPARHGIRVVEHPLGAEKVHAEVGDALVELGIGQLPGRALRPGRAQPRGFGRPEIGQPLHFRFDPELHQPVPAGRVLLPPLAPQLDGSPDGAPATWLHAASDRHPLVHEGDQRAVPALADLAQAFAVGNADVGEELLVELGITGHLAKGPHIHTRRMHVHDKVGQSLVLLRIGIASGEQQTEVGDVSHGCPAFLTVDDPLFPVKNGAGAESGDVRTGARLGEELAPDLLAGEQRTEIPIAHLVGSLRQDGRSRHSVADPVAAQVAERGSRGRQTLVDERLKAARQSKPAVADGEVHPRQAGVELGPKELDVGRRGGRKVSQQASDGRVDLLLVGSRARIRSQRHMGAQSIWLLLGG